MIKVYKHQKKSLDLKHTVLQIFNQNPNQCFDLVMPEAEEPTAFKFGKSPLPKDLHLLF